MFADEQLGNLRSQIDEQTDQITTLTKQNNSLRAELETHHVKQAAVSSNNRAASDKLADLAGQSKAYESQVATLTQALEASEQTCKQLNEEVTKCHARIQNLQREVDLNSNALSKTSSAQQYINEQNKIATERI